MTPFMELNQPSPQSIFCSLDIIQYGKSKTIKYSENTPTVGITHSIHKSSLPTHRIGLT